MRSPKKPRLIKAAKAVLSIPPVDEWGVKKNGSALLIDKYPKEVSGPLVIDIETNEDEENPQFVGIGFACDETCIYYSTELNKHIKKLLETSQLVGHNLKADAKWLKAWGVNVRPEQLIYDTMLASYVQDSTKESHGLKDLAAEMLGLRYPNYKEIVGKGRSKKTLDKQETEIVANYCGMDVLSTLRLYKLYQSSLTKEQARYLEEIELPVMRLLYEMEQIGVTVNVELLRELGTNFQTEIGRLVKTLGLFARRSGDRDGKVFNANSPQQVKGFLLQAGGINVASTGREALTPYEGVPLVKTLLRYRELAKLCGTYVEPLLRLAGRSRANRIHTTFNQVRYERGEDSWAGIRTGRLSSSSPNLHNISTRSESGHHLRRCFIASPGMKLIVADYSQIEWRVAAHLSKDHKMINVLANGEDIYQVVADKAKKTRRDTKTAILAANFGAQGPKIASVLHLDVSDGYAFLDAYRDSFPEFFLWRQRIEQQDTVTTIFGRTIAPKEANLKVPYIVQGSAADILKVAMLRCKEAGYVPILNVHDELLFEVANDGVAYQEFVADEIRKIMESVIKLDVPLKASIGIGESWAEGK